MVLELVDVLIFGMPVFTFATSSLKTSLRKFFTLATRFAGLSSCSPPSSDSVVSSDGFCGPRPPNSPEGLLP